MNSRHKYLRYCSNFAVVSALVLLGFATGCALLGSGNISVPHAAGYHLSAPGSWKAIAQPESDSAYKLNSGSVVVVNSSCNQDSQKSLAVLTHDLMLGDRNVNFMQSQKMAVNGGDGLYSSVRLTLNNYPFHMRLFVLVKAGCVFDFSLLSPHPVAESETNEFINFFKSFKYGN